MKINELIEKDIDEINEMLTKIEKTIKEEKNEIAKKMLKSDKNKINFVQKLKTLKLDNIYKNISKPKLLDVKEMCKVLSSISHQDISLLLNNIEMFIQEKKDMQLVKFANLLKREQKARKKFKDIYKLYQNGNGISAPYYFGYYVVKVDNLPLSAIWLFNGLSRYNAYADRIKQRIRDNTISVHQMQHFFSVNKQITDLLNKTLQQFQQIIKAHLSNKKDKKEGQ